MKDGEDPHLPQLLVRPDAVKKRKKIHIYICFPVGSVVNNPTANAGDAEDNDSLR